MVRTELLPSCKVDTVEGKGGIGLPGLNMENLASAWDGTEIKTALEPLANQYEDWIGRQTTEVANLPAELRAKALEHLDDCRDALRRMREGLGLIASNPLSFEAIQLANQAMLLQRQKSTESINFQLGKGRIFNAATPA